MMALRAHTTLKRLFSSTVGGGRGDCVRTLAALLREPVQPLLVDVRDVEEVARGKGGPPSAIDNAVHVPLNIDGRPQRERETTVTEFLNKLDVAGVALPSDKTTPIVTFCGSGGRGGRAQRLLKEAGFVNVFNGKGPAHLHAAGFNAAV